MKAITITLDTAKQDEQREQLYRAFHELPVVEQWETGLRGEQLEALGYKASLSDFIEELLLLGGMVNHPLRDTMFHPGNAPEEINKIRASAAGLKAAFENLHYEAAMLLEIPVSAWVSGLDKLISKLPEENIAARRGAPKKTVEQYLAFSSAAYFFAATGKKPNRSKNRGSYRALLEDVFRILNVNADADAQAKIAINRMIFE